MAKHKKSAVRSASVFLKKKLEDKYAFSQALHNGQNIYELAKKRGITLVQPI
ncbi:MAG: hypothetical protein MUC87_06635 [Bacteroidia bacterium]|nr:hypothetical protein [Bacteroidia bacterium]